MTSRPPFRQARLVVALVVLASLCAGHQASAQSLGEIAQQSEAKRKTVKSSGKVYTNDSLRSDSSLPQPAPVASSPAPPPSQSGVAGTDEAQKDDPAKDEAYWRQRVNTEREALDRAQTFAAALQSQINGLYGEFTACQSPTQCSDISANRQKSLAELDRVKKEIDEHTKALSDIQEEARRAGVPPGWVR